MRYTLALAACLSLLSARGALANNLPLSPFALPFDPVSLRAVPADHPLHHNLDVAAIENAPEKITWLFDKVVTAKELQDAVRTTIERSEMLASVGAKPEYRLTVRWIALDAPPRVSFKSEATSVMRWTVTRIATGEEVFASDVRTAYTVGGGGAAERRKATARFALMVNIASGVSCLDRAATAPPPADCALTPKVNLVMPRVPLITYYRR